MWRRGHVWQRRVGAHGERCVHGKWGVHGEGGHAW